MRKLLLILVGVAIAVAFLAPMVVSADSRLPDCCCNCGRNVTYRVSYSDDGQWVSQLVTFNTRALCVYPAFQAARKLGLVMGINCFVSRVFRENS